MQELGPITNWNKSVTSDPFVIHYPSSPAELQAIVANTNSYPSPVRAVGHAHSLVPCFAANIGEGDNKTGGTQIYMDHFDKIGDPIGDTITVGAGVRLWQLRDALAEHNMQLEVMPEIGNVTAGSMACCGTKDSSLKGANEQLSLGQISSTVLEVKLVNAAGNIEIINENTVVEGKRVNEQGDIENIDIISRRNDPNRLKDIRCSYGLIGIIYEVTFQIEPRRMIQTSYEVLNIDYDENTQNFTVPLLRQVIGNADGFLAFLQPFNRKIIVERRQYVDATQRSNLLGRQFRDLTWEFLATYISTMIDRSNTYLNKIHLSVDEDFSKFDFLIENSLKHIDTFRGYRGDSIIDFDTLTIGLDSSLSDLIIRDYINTFIECLNSEIPRNVATSLINPIIDGLLAIINSYIQPNSIFDDDESTDIFGKLEHLLDQIRRLPFINSPLEPPKLGPPKNGELAIEFDMKNRNHFFDFTFWAFPESRWDSAVPAFLSLLYKHFEDENINFRPVLPVEIYYIGRDQNSTLSFSANEPIFTFDLVDIRPDSQLWKNLNIEFNEMAIEHGGRPLFNQTKELDSTPQISDKLATIYGSEWDKFKARVKEADRKHRFVNEFFKKLLDIDISPRESKI